jgi:hypothetical protein
MGNGMFNYCIPEKSSIDNGSISFRAKAINFKKPKTVNEDYVIFLQCYFRQLFALRRFQKLYNEMINRFSEEFNENDKQAQEIVTKRDNHKKLYDIERKFKEEYGEFKPDNQRAPRITYTNRDNPYTGINSDDAKKKYYKSPVMLKNGDVYVGQWSFDFDKEKFYRNGYGKLYTNDGSKIEGNWSDFKTGHESRIFYANGKIYVGEISCEDITNFYNGSSEITVNKRNLDFKILYTASGFGTMYFPNGKVLKGRFEKDLPEGEIIEFHPGKFTLKAIYNSGVINYQFGVFTYYQDQSKYEGAFDSHFKRNGKGIMHFSNGNIFEGFWKKDKFHGQGLLFTPLNEEDVKEKKVLGNNDPDSTKFGKGIYTKATWIDGLLSGEGTITSSKHVTKCLWRFGKIIQSNIQATSSNSLNPNIFSFLNNQDLSVLLKIKNKVIKFYFTKNNNENLIKLRLSQMMELDSKFYYNYTSRATFNGSALPIGSNSVMSIDSTSRTHPCGSIYNKFLLENATRIKNIDDVIINYLHDITEFIPITAFKQDGGMTQSRFHYSNVFHPNLKNAYSSNYQLPKKNDIEITGVLNPNFIETEVKSKVNRINIVDSFIIKGKSNQMEVSRNQTQAAHAKTVNDSKLMLSNNLSSHEKHNILKRQLMRFQMDMRESHQEGKIPKMVLDDILTTAKDYIELYDRLLKDYKIDFYQIKVNDQNILNNCLSKLGDNTKGYFFSLHQIVINIPLKLQLYTVLDNPVRTLAIYIHNTPNVQNESDDIINSDITSQFYICSQQPNNTNTVNQTHLEKFLETINEQNKYSVMKIHDCERNTVVEFDTNCYARRVINFNSKIPQNSSLKRLVALIFLKDYNDVHLINLKNYFHLGKYVTVKLIDQTLAYGTKKTGIDIGTMILTGQNYYIEN